MVFISLKQNILLFIMHRNRNKYNGIYRDINIHDN